MVTQTLQKKDEGKGTKHLFLLKVRGHPFPSVSRELLLFPPPFYHFILTLKITKTIIKKDSAKLAAPIHHLRSLDAEQNIFLR